MSLIVHLHLVLLWRNVFVTLEKFDNSNRFLNISNAITLPESPCGNWRSLQACPPNRYAAMKGAAWDEKAFSRACKGFRVGGYKAEFAFQDSDDFTFPVPVKRHFIAWVAAVHMIESHGELFGSMHLFSCCLNGLAWFFGKKPTPAAPRANRRCAIWNGSNRFLNISNAITLPECG